MKEGIIVDISKNKLTVLTPEGDFVDIDHTHEFNQIGDLVYFEHAALNGRIRSFSSRKSTALKAVIALAAGILLIFSVLPLIIEDSKVYAYVSLGMDSNIEFSVSEDMEVLEVQGINEEGKEMLANLDGWQNQDVAIVAAQILMLLHKEGKTKEKKEVVFSTVLLDQDKSLEKNLEEKLTNVQAASIDTLEIKTQKATVDDRQKAKQKGISTAAYLETNSEDKGSKKTDGKENSTTVESSNSPAGGTSKDSRDSQQPSTKDEPKSENERKQSHSSKEEQDKGSKEKPTESLKSKHSNRDAANQKNEKKATTRKQTGPKRDVKKEKQGKPHQQWNSNRTLKEQKTFPHHDQTFNKGPKSKENNNKQQPDYSRNKQNHEKR